MKQLHITAQKPEKTGSGVYYRNLIEKMQNMGNEIIALYGEEEKNKIENCREYIFNYKKEINIAIPGMSDEMPYESTVYSKMTDEEMQKYIKYTKETIEKTIENEKPEVIIVHHLFIMANIAIEIAKKYKIPVFGISHGTDIRQIMQHERFKKHLDRIKEIDYVFALTNENKKNIEDIFEIENNKIMVTYGGYNEKIFYPNSEEKEKKARLMYAGKISETKGVYELIEAIQELNEEIEIIGQATGEDEEKIKKLIDNDKRIKYYNVRNQKELAELMRNREIFVFPTYYEGLGLMSIEAIASKMVLVVNKLDSIEEFIPKEIKESIFYQGVKKPTLKGLDKIDPSNKKEYKENLKEKIKKAIEIVKTKNINEEYNKIEKSVIELSWDGLSKKIYKKIEKVVDKDKKKE